MIEFRYRPDVDGLRAIAVMLVVLFHTGMGLTGGFIGVDVFFVISGYLITGLILREQEEARFSLRKFWVRRIRRIIPASACLVLCTLTAGFFLLLPADYEELAKTTVTQQAMLSNVYFWRNVGYFAGPADMKPLLHTWSLAVEEQFYLVYPLVLVVLGQWSRKVAGVILLLAAITSFAISIWGVNTHPGAAFYLLPTRAWELLAGGLIWYLPKAEFRSWSANGFSIAGLVCIIIPACLYSGETPFPGVAALPPCLGAALLIHVNSHKASLTARFLETKPMVGIGLISYSLYLWHWPLVAYSKYWLVDESVTTATVIILVSVVAAYLSWRFVERPFRQDASRISQRPFVFAAGSTVALCSLAGAVYLANGLQSRVPADVQAMIKDDQVKEYGSTTRQAESGDFPTVGTANARNSMDFLIWGDSHAMAMGRFWEDLADENNVAGIIAAAGGTPPLLGVWRKGFGDDSPNNANVRWNRSVLSFIKQRHIKHVILVARWTQYVEGSTARQSADEGLPAKHGIIVDSTVPEPTSDDSQRVLRRALLRTIASLQDSGTMVWIVEQVPEQRFHAPVKEVLLARWGLGPELSGATLSEHQKRRARVAEVFQQLPKSQVRLIDPTSACFDENGLSIFKRDGVILFKDTDHLTSHGAEVLLRDVIAPIFIEIAAEAAQNRHLNQRVELMQ